MENQVLVDSQNNVPQKKKGKVLKIVGIVFLCVVGLFSFVWLLTGKLVTVVENHFELLSSGNIEEAYTGVSQAFKDNTDLDTYKKLVTEDFPALSQYKTFSFSQRQIENNRGFLVGTMTTQSGTVYPVEIDFIKENGEWKIYGFDFNN